MPDPNAPSASFSIGRKWSISVNVAISVVAALGLVVMANYLGTRYFTRFHWTKAITHQLSPHTARVLESLTNEVKVVVFFDRQEPLYHSVAALLKEYHLANPRKFIVEHVDYTRNPGAAEIVKQKYKFSFAGEDNLVIFDSGGRTKTVYQRELSEYNVEALLGGAKEVKRTKFKGEMLFTPAILNVTDARQLKVYFLEGRGEHDPDSDDNTYGYSSFATVLKHNNLLVHPLRLSGTNEVPADCDLLIMAGPTETYPDHALLRMENYLDQGGRFLACFRYRYETHRKPGVEKVLAKWGVAVGDNWVIDLPNSLNKKQDIVITNFAGHTIVRPLIKSDLWVFLPRSIDKLPATRSTADAPKVEPLFYTGTSGEARTEPQATSQDRQGAIPLAVAVEKGGIQGLSANRGTTRMVIVGDSLFLGNAAVNSSYRNRDFAVLAINWLLDRPQLMGGIGPSPLQEYTLNLTQSQMRTVRWVLLAVMPGGILLAGLLVWWRRRH